MSQCCALRRTALCLGFKGCGRSAGSGTAVSGFLKGAAVAELVSDIICPQSQRGKSRTSKQLCWGGGVPGINTK